MDDGPGSVSEPEPEPEPESTGQEPQYTGQEPDNVSNEDADGDDESEAHRFRSLRLSLEAMATALDSQLSSESDDGDLLLNKNAATFEKFLAAAQVWLESDEFPCSRVLAHAM